MKYFTLQTTPSHTPDRSELDIFYRESLRLDQSLLWLRKILNKEIFNTVNLSRYHKAIDSIETRAADPNIYMGVVGEFSSGKSSLINGLLRKTILKSDVLQATTAAVTTIRQGNALDCSIIWTDKSKDVLSHMTDSGCSPSPDNLVSFIHKHTAVEDTAKMITEVIIEHPSELLERGIVIRDTPGTNSTNSRHTEVTQRAIRETCDAAIVVIPATSPVSESLLEYLSANLKDTLDRCVFVITKLDLIRRKSERDQLISVISARLQAGLDLSKPPVILRMSAPFVLENMEDCEVNSRLKEEDKQFFADEFGVSESLLLETLERKRWALLAGRVAILFSNLLDELTKQIKSLEADYSKSQLELANTEMRNLSEYLNEELSIWHQKFDTRSNAVISSLKYQLTNLRGNIVNKAIFQLKVSTNKDALKYNMGESAMSKLASEFQTDAKLILDKVLYKFEDAYEEGLESFENDFEVHYRQLKLGALNSVAKASSSVMKLSDMNNSTRRVGRQLATEFSSAKSGNKMFNAGSTFCGGWIGQVIIPVPILGFIIGGIAGRAFASMFGPSLNSLKNTFSEELRNALTSSFTETIPKIEKIAMGFQDQFSDQIEQSGMKYGDRYKTIIRDIRDDHATRTASVNNALKDISSVRHSLIEHQRYIETFLTMIKESAQE